MSRRSTRNGSNVTASETPSPSAVSTRQSPRRGRHTTPTSQPSASDCSSASPTSSIGTTSTSPADIETGSDHCSSDNTDDSVEPDVLGSPEPAIISLATQARTSLSPEPFCVSPQEDETDNDEDDDAYNAVDLISQSDGEEPTMEDFEEQEIINDCEEDAIHHLGNDFHIEHDGTLFPGDMPYFADQMRRIVYSNLAEDIDEEEGMKSPVFGTIPSAPSPPPPTPTNTTRRVRFDASAMATPRSLLFDDEGVFDNSLFDETMGDALHLFGGFDSEGDTTDEDEVPINTTKSPRALLRQPTWDMDLPSSPPSSAHGRSGRNTANGSATKSSANKAPCVPRVATWSVHPGKALAQSDENHKIVIMTPVNPHAQGRVTRGSAHVDLPPTDLVTGYLQKAKQEILPSIETGGLPGPALGSDMPDPVLGTGTDGKMVVMMEGIIGDDDDAITTACATPITNLVAPIPIMNPTTTAATFLPANDALNDLTFAAANSDHESTDLDIMDYITFSSDDDNDDSDDEALSVSDLDACDLLTEDDLQTTMTPTKARPRITSAPSIDRTSPSSIDVPYQSPFASSYRRGGLSSKATAQLRKTHGGLALTKPATRAGLRTMHPPPKFDRKRKLSDAHGGTAHAKRPNLRKSSGLHR